MPDTLDILEVIWIVVAFAGVLFSLYNLRRAEGDVDFLKKHRIDNSRLLVGRTVFIAEAARTAGQSLLLLVGVLAGLLPNPPLLPTDITFLSLASVTVRLSLIAASGLLSYSSFINYRLRRELEE